MAIDPKLYHLLLETFKGELSEQHQVLVDALLNLEDAKSKKKREEVLGLLFRVSHNLKGAAKSVELDDIAAVAHELEDTFSLWREQEEQPKKEQIDNCLLLADKMVSLFDETEEGRPGSTYVQDEMIQVPLRRVERVNAKLGEFIVFQLRLNNWVKQTQRMSHILEKAIKSNMQQEVLELAQDVKHMSEDAETLSGEFSRDLFILHQEARKMRLLPISRVLSPLKRTVREAAEEVDKQVELFVEGGSVEIDKSILDILKSPLQHLVRNAIAHGIETPKAREALGKAVPAPLKIQVSNKGGKINIMISDDGCGLDIERIKQSALEKNLCTEAALAGMKEKEIYGLIFKSGLSTAEQVSELSGRGVGLDAVLADMKRVKGSIDVNSVKGQGTQFTLSLPPAMVSSRGLFVKLRQQLFMLPTISLNALYDVPCDTLQRVDNQWVKVIDERPIVVASLFELLGMGAQALDIGRRYDGIHVSHDNQEAILLVDEIVEEHECVIKPMPHPLSELQHIAGATLTEHGALVLSLSMEHLLEKVHQGKGAFLSMEGLRLEQNEGINEAINVLVVDDTLTTRTLAMNALRAAGYETLDAGDGQKAWDLIQKNKIDCVVTDIQMPVMDGFELTQAIKGDERYKDIPVVIVSSCEAKEDKKRGMDVGASAYIVKSDFDTRTLIDMVASLL